MRQRVDAVSSYSFHVVKEKSKLPLASDISSSSPSFLLDSMFPTRALIVRKKETDLIE